MLPEALEVMRALGFTDKPNLIWHKVRKDGGSDGRGVGFYFLYRGQCTKCVAALFKQSA